MRVLTVAMATEKKYGSGGRKQFVRTRVPAAESFASAVILLLLGVITAVHDSPGETL